MAEQRSTFGAKRRVLIGILFIVLCGYLAWAILAFFIQDLLVFPPLLLKSQGGMTPPAGVEEWTIDTEEGVVHAWFISGGRCSEASPCGTVVMMHGNGMLIDDWIDTARWFPSMGWNVLLPEFRGYGRAEGKPSERALRNDVAAFIDLLHQRPEVDPHATVFYGRSIGGALAAQVAEIREPAGMILQTPPASIASMAWRYGLPPFLVRNKFDTVDALEDQSGVPILLIEHDQDAIIPASHLAKLRLAAPHADSIILRGDHNQLENMDQQRLFIDAVESFLDEIRNGQTGQ